MNTVKGKPRYAAVDVFCGIGGLTCGLQRSGIPVVAGFDADTSCEYAYETNNDAAFVGKRIEETTPEEVNGWFPEGAVRILVGCAPCQPFSSYSSSTRRRDSWRLLMDFGELIEGVQPDVVSMENVTRLRSFSNGEVFGDFVKGLEALGYAISTFNVKCELYGVPQTRRRLVLFASRFGEILLVEPTRSRDCPPTVREAIGLVPSLSHGQSHKEDRFHTSQGLTETNLARIRSSVPGGTWRDWPRELRSPCHQRSSGSSYQNVYGRMEWDQVGPTITTGCFSFGRGRFGHPEQDRAISLREAALLQTFPSDYEFLPPDEKVRINRLGRQIGNAVPVALGEAIGRSIVEHLNGRENV